MKGGALFPVRLRYTKRGKVRWISHRDVARAFERALRIEQLPLAFTEGFSPRPKVSFGLALPTGYESDAEYLDLELVSEVDLDTLPAAISDALPSGIDVIGASALDERAPALMDVVTSTEWVVTVVASDGSPLARGALTSTVDDALQMPVLDTTRHRKGREVVEDVRPVISRIDVHRDVEGNDTSCTMELRTQPRSAKPGDVLAAIASATAISGGLAEAGVLRTHQWIERDGARLEPHCADTRPRVLVARDLNKGTPDVRRDHDTGTLAGVAHAAGGTGPEQGN
ncbi:MAG: radical SAM-linked protein [Actinomycetia bacterium]|nr:radical SAM-linked protein [Actinomycetes bacterium]